MNGQRQPDYIVVEGPIGVGKTSLAKRLATTFKTDLMLNYPVKIHFLNVSTKIQKLQHYQHSFIFYFSAPGNLKYSARQICLNLSRLQIF